MRCSVTECRPHYVQKTKTTTTTTSVGQPFDLGYLGDWPSRVGTDRPWPLLSPAVDTVLNWICWETSGWPAHTTSDVCNMKGRLRWHRSAYGSVAAPTFLLTAIMFSSVSDVVINGDIITDVMNMHSLLLRHGLEPCFTWTTFSVCLFSFILSWRFTFTETTISLIIRDGVQSVFRCCLMSSDVGWRIRDKLKPMREHGSVLLYVHGKHKAR